jgi:hypothetical protein
MADSFLKAGFRKASVENARELRNTWREERAA